MNEYQRQGYADRNAYLKSLAEDYGDIVYVLASVLPESEDFDGLITELEDCCGEIYE